MSNNENKKEIIEDLLKKTMNNNESGYQQYDKSKVDESIKTGVKIVKNFFIAKIITIIIYIILLLIVLGFIFGGFSGNNIKYWLIIGSIVLVLIILIIILRRIQKR